MLALPALEETKKDWRAQDDYAVTFLDRYGNEIGRRGILHRQAVPIDELPDHVIKAVLGTEDRRFFDHYGIDLMGLSRALSQNMRANGVVQGGSTITQQLAKNLFLSNERTIERKVKEAFLALWLESNLSKKEILQLYLDRAYMGGGTFGIDSRVQSFYFRQECKGHLAGRGQPCVAGLFKLRRSRAAASTCLQLAPAPVSFSPTWWKAAFSAKVRLPSLAATRPASSRSRQG